MKKKIVAIGVALMLMAGLAACGGKGNGKQEEGKDFVYTSEYLSLPLAEEGLESNIEVLQIVDNMLYYRLYTWSEDGASENNIYSLNLMDTSEEPQKVDFQLPENQYAMKTVISQDGDFYMAVNEFSPMDSGEGDSEMKVVGYGSPANIYKLVKYQKDGTKVYEMDMSSMASESEYFYVQYMEIDKAGNAYVSNGDNKIWVFGPEGNLLFELGLDNWISGMGSSKSGDVYITQYGQNGMQLMKIDLATKSFSGSLTGLPQNLSGNTFSKGIEKDFLFYGERSVYEYDIEKQSYEVVLDFIDVDLVPNYVRYITAMEDGRVFVYMEDWETNQRDLLVLTRKAASDVVEKEILTLSCMYLDSNVQKAIVNFNKTNDKYRITVKDYSENMGNSETAWQDAITKMNNDFLTGNAGDLITLDQINIGQLAAKGILEDLNPYLDASSVLKREEMVESVLEAYSENGILTTIPQSFYVWTLISASSLVGDEMGWTLDEMMAAADKMPEGSQILQYASKSMVLQSAIIMNQNEFIDWSTGECKFTGEGFLKLLEFANRFPQEYSWQEDAPNMPDLVREGKLLLVDQSLSNVDSYQIIHKIWGEPVTCIGYPSTTNNGSAIAGQGSVGINAKSKHKDGAWAFLESLVAESGKSRNSWGFPVLKSGVEKLFEDAMKVEYVLDANGEKMLDENGEPMQHSKGGYGWGNSETFEIYAASQEEVDAVRKVIENTTARYSYDTQLSNIILEEAEPFFAGQKSAAEVADIIQSRIQIYVNESR